ncbi:MAG TPA: hypothetical protein ENI54_05400 [bacterium]|nr:hypothetical protein [bacterium]
MKEKSLIIKNLYGRFNKKIGLFKPLLFIFILAIFLSPLFLSGCAKTEYPLPPKIKPPHPPVILSAKKIITGIAIVYKYNYDINKIEGFLIYEKRYKNKESIKYSCGASKPIAFQNITFKRRFSLQYGKFFYNVNKSNLKNGYYVFCVKSVGAYSTKSVFSNYIIAHVVFR